MATVKWDHRLVNAKDFVVNAKSNQVFVDFFHKEEQLYSSCYQVRDFVVSTVEILFYFLKPISTHSIIDNWNTKILLRGLNSGSILHE